MKKNIFIFFLLLLSCSPVYGSADVALQSDIHPIQELVGENLQYDISFLWFDHLAEGSLSLLEGDQPDTFLVVLEAKTLGLAAFFTRDRVERYQTMMKIGPDGMLIPLWHSSHTIRGKGKSRKEKITRYDFDYSREQVVYKKIKNGHEYAEQIYHLDKKTQLFDILSALYNLRLGFFPKSEQGVILIPTFNRKGPQDIVVAPLKNTDPQDQKFLDTKTQPVRILVDPEVFGTKGRDIFASFDQNMRPAKGIIKNVIGLGDVRGALRER